VSALPFRLTFVALGFTLAVAPAPAAAADAPLHYCRSVAAKLKADGDLAVAARAAFGEPQSTDDETCLYPLQLLRYADVDVLVSQNGEPGEDCHGCEASLSATVLKRVPGGAKRLRAFPSFAKGGTFGAVASVTPIAIGGDDGIAIESGGLFQGYASSALDLYAFRQHGLVALAAGAPLIVAGDNSGAETDARKTIEVESAWSLANGELTIDYRVTDASGKRDSRAVWSVAETTLTPKSGAPPKELARATGQE
jgi:hypothetical protein